MSDRRTAWGLVGAQFLLLALILLLPSGDAWGMPTGLRWALRAVAMAGLIPMAVAGIALGRGLTAVPIPNAHAELRTGGPYRWVRHPIYSGLLLAALAWSIASGSPWVLVCAGLLVALINVKARWEERRLAERFPGYATYAARTPRFIPRLVPR